MKSRAAKRSAAKQDSTNRRGCVLTLDSDAPDDKLQAAKLEWDVETVRVRYRPPICELRRAKIGMSWRRTRKLHMATGPGLVHCAPAANADEPKPDLVNEIVVAVMDALTAHSAMSKQALDSEKLRADMKDVLLGAARLWEGAAGEVDGRSHQSNERSMIGRGVRDQRAHVPPTWVRDC